MLEPIRSDISEKEIKDKIDSFVKSNPKDGLEKLAQLILEDSKSELPSSKGTLIDDIKTTVRHQITGTPKKRPEELDSFLREINSFLEHIELKETTKKLIIEKLQQSLNMSKLICNRNDSTIDAISRTKTKTETETETENKFDINYKPLEIFLWFYNQKMQGKTSLELCKIELYRLTPDQWNAFFVGIQSAGITSLDVSGNDLYFSTPFQLSALFNGIANSGLTLLNISNNSFDDLLYKDKEKFLEIVYTHNITAQCGIKEEVILYIKSELDKKNCKQIDSNKKASPSNATLLSTMSLVCNTNNVPIISPPAHEKINSNTDASLSDANLNKSLVRYSDKAPIITPPTIRSLAPATNLLLRPRIIEWLLKDTNKNDIGNDLGKIALEYGKMNVSFANEEAAKLFQVKCIEFQFRSCVLNTLNGSPTITMSGRENINNFIKKICNLEPEKVYERYPKFNAEEPPAPYHSSNLKI